jgi:hypothetical protein
VVPDDPNSRIGERYGYKVERKAFSTIEFECLLKQTDGGKNGTTDRNGIEIQRGRIAEKISSILPEILENCCN